ncbi:uncharacterized protein G2W53_022101 [Senna tora]|uniref:Uncharacterized protein n=1 Tax=Senna tora TaxID=362788 RepID=A0A834WIF6_9FABA|nr:uncharacterized protein G2W53_022101 [Senna tora]
MSKRVVALVSQTDLFALDLGIRVDLMGLVIALKMSEEDRFALYFGI